jgi:hypothetical protein
MLMRGDIWTADLARAMHDLHPADDSTRDLIAAVLGFEPIAVGAAPTPPTFGPLDPIPIATAPDSAAADQQLPASDLLSRQTAIERLLPLPSLPSRASIGVDAQFEPVDPLRLDAPVPGEYPAISPLLSALAGRFIAKELVSSERVGHEPDLERLIAHMARHELPNPIPLETHRTLARGVQVLVDRGEGMEPFAADQQALVDLLRRLVGHALVSVQTIYEAPDRADPLYPWKPPPPGTPVLALTDLGLGSRADLSGRELIAAWRTAAAVLAPRRSTLVALIPYPRDRWPSELAAVVRLVEWDRPTTAAAARVARDQRSFR